MHCHLTATCGYCTWVRAYSYKVSKTAREVRWDRVVPPAGAVVAHGQKPLGLFGCLVNRTHISQTSRSCQVSDSRCKIRPMSSKVLLDSKSKVFFYFKKLVQTNFTKFWFYYAFFISGLATPICVPSPGPSLFPNNLTASTFKNESRVHIWDRMSPCLSFWVWLIYHKKSPALYFPANGTIFCQRPLFPHLCSLIMNQSAWKTAAPGTANAFLRRTVR